MIVDAFLFLFLSLSLDRFRYPHPFAILAIDGHYVAKRVRYRSDHPRFETDRAQVAIESVRWFVSCHQLFVSGCLICVYVSDGLFGLHRRCRDLVDACDGISVFDVHHDHA